MVSGSGGAAEWPDEAERDRWWAALQRVAARVERERGVVEPLGMEVDGRALWATYADLRFRVAGEYADLAEEGLFDEVDDWVAFEREAGPGTELERDRAYVASVRARFPAATALWEAAVVRVLRDVTATTGMVLRWRVAVHEDEEVPLRWTGTGDVGLFAVPAPSGAWPRRPLRIPELWLEAEWQEARGSWERQLDVHETDPEDAVLVVASYVQDDLIQELPGAWPACPGHGHPRELDAHEGVAVWRCPRGSGDPVPVGSLAH